MLTGIVFLTGATFLGIGLVRRLAPLRALLNHAEQVMWGLVTGWMLSTLGAYFVARMLGRLSFRPMLALTVAIWTVALLLLIEPLRRVRRGTFRLKTLWRVEYGGLALVLALFAPVYVRLFATHMLAPGAEGIYSGGNTWYDIGFHLALATSFLDGQNFPPIYTPFPPAPLLYPFLPDFQVAALGSLGMSLRAALLLTSIPLALAITGLFYSFARRMVTPAGDESSVMSSPRSPHVAVLATILFLLNGGLGFIYFFGDWRQSGKTLAAFWSQLSLNYANLGERKIQWTNFIADMLLPQRSSLFGFPLALMVFALFAVVWRKWSVRAEEKNPWCGWRLLLIAGVLTGLLPLFHAHVYLGLGLVSGFLFLLRPRRQWLAFWIPALLLASPYLVELAGHVSVNSFIRFQPGWRGGGERVWLWYWLRNTGLPMLLIFPAWFVAPAVWRRFYLAFACLLIFSLLVVVSPNNYDNIKLMYLWYAPTSVLVAAWIVRLAYVHRQKVLASVLVVLCIASGLLALQYENVSHNLLFTYEEMAAATFARERTAPRALFLTAPTLHQPILSLAGRPVLRGDTAWLWSHGYEFAQREADVKSIYAGSDEAQTLIDYYGVDYIYLGPRERQAGANQDFFETRFPVIYHSQNIAIYDVSRKDLKAEGQLPAAVAPREFASRLDKDPYQLLVEFPRASYAVYRFYQAGFKRQPRYEEFMSDMTVVGRGLYVGAPGWQQVLEANKKTLAEKWLERTDFKVLYDGKSNAQYVDALFGNMSQTPNGNERDGLLATLDKGSQSRGHVLLQVSENTRYRREDYNAAYVLVHYFGYLHRNPGDAPDNNLAGYNFWLNELNHTGDYRSLSRVFIESGEYKDQVKRKK